MKALTDLRYLDCELALISQPLSLQFIIINLKTYVNPVRMRP